MITRLHQNQRMSGVVTWPASGSMVVVSGQVADDKTLDVAGQTADVLAKIDRLLADAGVSKADALYAYIWLPDIGDFDAMNAVWDKWLAPGSAPAPRHRRGQARRSGAQGRDPGLRPQGVVSRIACRHTAAYRVD